MFEGGDEELGAPRSGGWRGRIVTGLVVVVVLAAAVLALRRHPSTTPDAAPTTSAAPSVAAGPVIPTFSKAHPRPSGDASEILFAGRDKTQATLYGPVPLLTSPCLGKRCVPRYSVPAAAARAVHAVLPGCPPALLDVVRRGPPRARTELRLLLCVYEPTTLVVNIVRAHSSVVPQGHVDGGRSVYAAHVHGPYTVQVVLQKRTGSLPDIATARALAEDPRLLAGI